LTLASTSPAAATASLVLPTPTRSTFKLPSTLARHTRTGPLWMLAMERLRSREISATSSLDATIASQALLTPTRLSFTSRTGDRDLGPNGHVKMLTMARLLSRPILANTWLDATTASKAVLLMLRSSMLTRGSQVHGRNSKSSTSSVLPTASSKTETSSPSKPTLASMSPAAATASVALPTLTR
ncbi:unnamed protein product, partial [Aphanomyces euteiches]